MNQSERVVTCVYCGMAYPDGTPRHGSEILTEHIKVCPKHPMREAEQKIARLRKALLDLVGVSDPDELRIMKDTLRSLPAPSEDKIVMIDAINVLLETRVE